MGSNGSPYSDVLWVLFCLTEAKTFLPAHAPRRRHARSAVWRACKLTGGATLLASFPVDGCNSSSLSFACTTLMPVTVSCVPPTTGAIVVASLFVPALRRVLLESPPPSPSPYLPSWPPQGPPGTGKTRTIMGIVGVLLAGGCPFPTGHTRDGLGASRGSGAKVTVGSSVAASSAKPNKADRERANHGGKKKGERIASPLENARTRVLIVAPSNAAVDELVLRLCQDGVPSADGGVRFPRVVRVGGGRVDREVDGEGGGGGSGGGAGGGRGMGGGKDGLRAKVVEVRMLVLVWLWLWLWLWLCCFFISVARAHPLTNRKTSAFSGKKRANTFLY